MRGVEGASAIMLGAWREHGGGHVRGTVGTSVRRPRRRRRRHFDRMVQDAQISLRLGVSTGAAAPARARTDPSTLSVSAEVSKQ